MMRRKRARAKGVKLSWLSAAAVLALSCERPEYSYVPDLSIEDGSGATFGSGGASFAGGTGPSGTAGGLGEAGSFSVGTECLLGSARSPLVLSNQVIANQRPARRHVYLQLTAEEVEQLEATGELFPPRPAAPPSTLVTLLAQLQVSATEQSRPLLRELASRFRVTRAAWPNPWALRLVEHGRSERTSPVLLTLREDAWVARISDGVPAVVDMNNSVVSLAAAAAEPERIAAVYYVVDDRSPGAVATCETGKRELLVGNPSMVESFAIGTAEVVTRLEADLTALRALLEVVRPCGSLPSGGGTFHASTVCQTWRLFDASTELSAYEWSLANPVAAYEPTVSNLTTLIQALEADRSVLQPFVGAPVLDGAGGQGGAPADGGAAGYSAGGDGDGGAAGDASGF